MMMTIHGNNASSDYYDADDSDNDEDNTNNKQLLDEVFVISGIIKVEVSVISRAEGQADNTYRDLDYLGYHKNRI